MLIKKYSVRAKNESQCVISWTSESKEMHSWIFINGKFAIGPFMPMTLERSITIPFLIGTTVVIEIHDFDDLEIIPNSCEEMPQIKPLLSWNPVDEAAKYRVYHGDFVTGEESMVSEVNARPGIARMEINSPIVLDGKNGHWYWFRVESLDKYNNESLHNGELVKYFASDLPPIAELTITKQPNGKYQFQL